MLQLQKEWHSNFIIKKNNLFSQNEQLNILNTNLSLFSIIFTALWHGHRIWKDNWTQQVGKEILYKNFLYRSERPGLVVSLLSLNNWYSANNFFIKRMH